MRTPIAERPGSTIPVPTPPFSAPHRRRDRPRTHWLRGLAAAAVRSFALLIGLLTVVFAAVRLAPGDPVDHLLGEHATESERSALRSQLHLDGTIAEQFRAMLGDIADGSLGTSRHGGKPRAVLSLIAERVPSTAALALAAMAVALLIAVPLGILAALQPGGLADQLARISSLLAVSTPAFVSGPLALYGFAVILQWAPTPAHSAHPAAALAVPALVIGWALSGRLARLLRASLLEVLASDLVLALRARGVPTARLLWRHALPNAALPVLTVLGLQLAALLGGALVTEKVFGRPGLGSLLLEAIATRDHAVVQGCVLVIGAVYLVVTGAVDWLTAWLDPRLHAGAVVGS